MVGFTKQGNPIFESIADLSSEKFLANAKGEVGISSVSEANFLIPYLFIVS
jgi:hypothetical protein